MIGVIDLVRARLSSSLVLVLVCSSYFLYLCFTNTLLTKTWGDTSALLIKFSGDQPESVRAKVIYAGYLETLGLPEFALPEIEEALALRPDLLSLHLNKIRLACAFGQEVDVNQTIENSLKSISFEISSLYQFKRIISFDMSSCPIFLAKPDLLELLFSSVPSMHGAGNRKIVMANFYNIKADYYVIQKKFSPALEAIDKAIEFTPTVDLLLRKGVLLASAGLYEEAIKAIESALIADENRGIFIPSRSVELNYVINSLRNQLKK
jgi:tetratricopeptide (TPR) repeat protein